MLPRLAMSAQRRVVVTSSDDVEAASPMVGPEGGMLEQKGQVTATAPATAALPSNESRDLSVLQHCQIRVWTRVVASRCACVPRRRRRAQLVLVRRVQRAPATLSNSSNSRRKSAWLV